MGGEIIFFPKHRCQGEVKMGGGERGGEGRRGEGGGEGRGRVVYPGLASHPR